MPRGMIVTLWIGSANGSKTVTGFAFEAKYAGSFVKIGDAFYRYGGTASAVHSPRDKPAVASARKLGTRS